MEKKLPRDHLTFRRLIVFGDDSMNTEGFKRKLTAVFSADVVGYSRLMGKDETATVKTLATYKVVMFILGEREGRPSVNQ